MFALEDIIGGHAAVANFVTKVIGFIAKNKEVQQHIQTEVDNLLMERCEKSVTIADRNKLIYTEATIMESLRLITSPIVPHVANQDSSIDGELIYNQNLLPDFNGIFSFYLRLLSQSRHIIISQQLRFEYVDVALERAGKVCA